MHSVGQTYKDYRKELPKYKAWQKQRDIYNAKKEYLFKTKPPSEEELKKAKAKANILFNAIDIMDDYSQEQAEDAENIVLLLKQSVKKNLSKVCLGIGLGVGLTKFSQNFWRKILSKSKKISKHLNEPIPIFPGINTNILQIASIYSAYIISSLALGLVSEILFSKYSAKLEVESSKAARFEAMQKELNDYNQFAILNDEQKEKVNNIAKTIQLTKEEKKTRKLKTNYEMLDFSTPFKTIKKLLFDKKAIIKRQKDYFKVVNDEIKENYNRNLRDDEILEAKKDRELLTSMIEKVDIKSQDYAENTELVTQFASIGIELASPFLAGPILNLANKIKNPIVSGLTFLVSFLTLTIAPLLYFANLQKMSSKIARYKTVEEMRNNPASYIYYSDEEINAVDESKIKLKKEEKDNIFKFIPKIIKEYKEYKKYVKENDEKDKKYNKALKQIEITKEQEKEAAKFQRNTFFTFNKIDDNSQKYSENVEAHWEIISTIATLAISLISFIACGFMISKLPFQQILEKLDDYKNNTLPKDTWSRIIGAITTLFTALATPIICEIISTKQQKEASRVANYKAIEELKDYQNFA